MMKTIALASAFALASPWLAGGAAALDAPVRQVSGISIGMPGDEARAAMDRFGRDGFSRATPVSEQPINSIEGERWGTVLRIAAARTGSSGERISMAAMVVALDPANRVFAVARAQETTPASADAISDVIARAAAEFGAATVTGNDTNSGVHAIFQDTTGRVVADEGEGSQLLERFDD